MQRIFINAFTYPTNYKSFNQLTCKMQSENTCVKIGERKKLQGIVHNYVRNEKGNYVCMYCPKTSRKQSTISEHITRIHQVEAGRQIDPFECPNCMTRFNSASIRDHHIITHHTDTKNHHCTHHGCKYDCKHAAALLTHYVRKHMAFDTMITHVSKTEAICNHCNACMKTPSIAYHVGKCNPLSPYCKTLKGKTLELSEEEDEEEIVIRPCINSEIPKKNVSSKPQPPLIIQSAISERIETPSESIKPLRPTRHLL